MMKFTTLILSAAILAPAVCAKDAPILGIGAPAPQGATVLFNGKDTSAWNNPWKVSNGVITAGGGDTTTKAEFTDYRLHVEFKPPYKPEAHGQERGNSGVYMKNRYEVQVLDSYGIADPGKGDCGAIYNIAAPLVNACKPPQEWQAYDIVFRSARFGADGKKTDDARITVFLNGQLIQNNTDITGVTGGAQDEDESKPGPIRLQDHGNPVQYRNIWIQPLPLKGADHY